MTLKKIYEKEIDKSICYTEWLENKICEDKKLANRILEIINIEVDTAYTCVWLELLSLCKRILK